MSWKTQSTEKAWAYYGPGKTLICLHDISMVRDLDDGAGKRVGCHVWLRHLGMPVRIDGVSAEEIYNDIAKAFASEKK